MAEKFMIIYFGEELTEEQDDAFLAALKAAKNKHPSVEKLLTNDGFHTIYTEMNSPGIEFPERFPDRPDTAKDAAIFVTDDNVPVALAVKAAADKAGIRIVGFEEKSRPSDWD